VSGALFFAFSLLSLHFFVQVAHAHNAFTSPSPYTHSLTHTHTHTSTCLHSYKLGNVFKKAKGPILRFDYSDDSTFIQLNDESGQLLFCDATTGMQIPSANELRDLDWPGAACAMAYPMRGLWPARADASGPRAIGAISGVAVSSKVSDDQLDAAAPQRQLVARCDPDGLVTVFRYPCTSVGAVGVSYAAHATDCAAARWAGDGFPARSVTGAGGGKKDGMGGEAKSESEAAEIAGALANAPKGIPGDRYLLTLGGRDRCLMRWDRSYVDPDKDAIPYEAKQTDGSLVDMATSLAFNTKGARRNMAEGDAAVMRDRAIAESKEQLKRTFMGSLVDPSDPQPHDPLAPQLTLELEHVYGYSCQETGRDNLFYGGSVSGTRIIYPAGKVGVVYKKDGNSQQFYFGHDDDITCMDVDMPSGRFACTGQRGSEPCVKMWNIDTATEIMKMPRAHRGAIIDVKFNRTGTRICSVGMGNEFDPSYTLAVYCASSRAAVGADWAGGTALLMATQKCGVEAIMVAHWIDRVASSNAFDIFIGRQKSVQFWRQEDPKTLTSTKGIFDRAARVQPQCAAACIGDALVTGCANGQLYVWAGSKVRRVVPAHRGMVCSMQVVGPGGEKMVTGSRDGTVKIWDRALEIVRTFDMKQMASQQCVRPYVRAVCMDRTMERIVVGLASSDIYEICYASGSATLLSRGHFEGEVWGLAPHPTDPDKVATSGDDNTVRIWNSSLHELEQVANVDAPCRAIEWSPQGDLIGLGTGTGAVDEGDGAEEKSGAIVLLNAESMEIVHEGRDSREWIRFARFSPDGKLFLVGSEDHEMLVYDIAKGFKLKSKCQKHSGGVMAADFSKCSTWIRSNCVNNELHFFRANSGELNAGGGMFLGGPFFEICFWVLYNIFYISHRIFPLIFLPLSYSCRPQGRRMELVHDAHALGHAGHVARERSPQRERGCDVAGRPPCRDR
jgi:WD40 repeat protein